MRSDPLGAAPYSSSMSPYFSRHLSELRAHQFGFPYERGENGSIKHATYSIIWPTEVGYAIYDDMKMMVTDSMSTSLGQLCTVWIECVRREMERPIRSLKSDQFTCMFSVVKKHVCHMKRDSFCFFLCEKRCPKKRTRNSFLSLTFATQIIALTTILLTLQSHLISGPTLEFYHFVSILWHKLCYTCIMTSRPNCYEL